MKFNREKFKAMVLHICNTAPPGKLGRVKLNKILWFSEKSAYDFFGETITGESYIKKPRGPVAAHLAEIEHELMQQGMLKVSESPQYENTRYRCKTTPELTEFSEKELVFINFFIDAICNKHTSVTISNITHDAIWKKADMGDVLSFASYHGVKTRTPTVEELEWAEQCHS